MNKLIWSRLKSMKCPRCNNLVKEALPGYGCTKCDFVIGMKKFNEIITTMYLPRTRPEEPDDRLSELNNLGREIEGENYKQPDN